MRILVDTHVLMWCDREPRRVAPSLMASLRDPQNDIFVSVASVWEIAIKRATGKLTFTAPITETIERLGFDLIPITAAHAEHAGGLPRHHSDPFDRMLVAQATLEGLVLGTNDPLMQRYAVPLLGLA